MDIITNSICTLISLTDNLPFSNLSLYVMATLNRMLNMLKLRLEETQYFIFVPTTQLRNVITSWMKISGKYSMLGSNNLDYMNINWFLIIFEVNCYYVSYNCYIGLNSLAARGNITPRSPLYFVLVYFSI